MLCKTFDFFSYGMGVYTYLYILCIFFVLLWWKYFPTNKHMHMSIAAEGDNSIHFIKCETTLNPTHFNFWKSW